MIVPMISALSDDGDSRHGRGMLWNISCALKMESIYFLHNAKPIRDEVAKMAKCLSVCFDMVKDVGYDDPKYRQATSHEADVSIAQENAINQLRIHMLHVPRFWGIPNPFLGRPEAVKRYLDALILLDKRQGTLVRYVTSTGQTRDVEESWRREGALSRPTCSLHQGHPTIPPRTHYDSTKNNPTITPRTPYDSTKDTIRLHQGHPTIPPRTPYDSTKDNPTIPPRTPYDSTADSLRFHQGHPAIPPRTPCDSTKDTLRFHLEHPTIPPRTPYDSTKDAYRWR